MKHVQIHLSTRTWKMADAAYPYASTTSGFYFVAWHCTSCIDIRQSAELSEFLAFAISSAR